MATATTPTSIGTPAEQLEGLFLITDGWRFSLRIIANALTLSDREREVAAR